MALQNIGIANRDDVFYRYKMPCLITKIEGRGNGIKTNLVNMVDIAKALARSPAYITKFYGCELEAQSKFDEKTKTAIVNGAHETAKLSSLLETFIKKYVQCYGCGNPETEVTVTKGQTIMLKCAACGFLSNVDMRDKLTTFILKNPPVLKSSKGLRKAESARLQAGEAIDAEMKRVRKENKKKGSNEVKHAIRKKASSLEEEGHTPKSNLVDGVENVNAEEEDIEWQTDTSTMAAQQRIKEQLNTVTRQMVLLSTATEKKDGKHVQEVCIEAEKEAEEEALPVDPACLFGKHFKDLKFFLDSGFSGDQLADRLKDIGSVGSKELQQEVMNAFFEALFYGVQMGLPKEIRRKKVFLEKAITDDCLQALLLRAMEAHYSSKSPEVCREVAVSLKVLYDIDVLEEELIVAWYHEGASSRVKQLAKPFVDWVQNAESEEE